MSDSRILITLKRNGHHVEVWQKGRGQDLLFLHGLTGLKGCEPLLEGLAQSFRVTAPHHPGFGHSTGVESIHDVLDSVLFVSDVIDALELKTPHLVGHSLGGMIAAELAAVSPKNFGRLILLAPFGLWDEGRPTLDFFRLEPRELAISMFHARSNPFARVIGAASPEATHSGPYYALIQGLAAAGRLLWPIPDRGLARRMNRITNPSLILWGQSDRIVSPAYAQLFVDGLAKSKSAILKKAGHMLPVELPGEVMTAILQFMGRKVGKGNREALSKTLAAMEEEISLKAKAAAREAEKARKAEGAAAGPAKSAEPQAKAAPPKKKAEKKKTEKKKPAKKKPPKKKAAKKKAGAKKPARKQAPKKTGKKTATKKTATKKTTVKKKAGKKAAGKKKAGKKKAAKKKSANKKPAKKKGRRR